jgi:hypothetical protein
MLINHGAVGVAVLFDTCVLIGTGLCYVGHISCCVAPPRTDLRHIRGVVIAGLRNGCFVPGTTLIDIRIKEIAILFDGCNGVGSVDLLDVALVIAAFLRYVGCIPPATFLVNLAVIVTSALLDLRYRVDGVDLLDAFYVVARTQSGTVVVAGLYN